MNFPKTWQQWTPWLSLLMGLVTYWTWGGAYTLAPGHVGWVMAGLDTRTHYLGWQFFRHSPWWQWPLGNNPADGSDAPGTIVLSDSIPGVAILLKLLSPLLPGDFQYFGFWALSCFLLQGWFACKLLGRLTDDVTVRLVGTAFFLSATIFLLRVYMHPALATQWLLIAGLYLVFDRRFRSRAWLVLLCAAILIHAYLFVMLAALWFADLVQRLWRRECPFKKILLHVLSAVIVVLILMWGAGYLVTGSTLVMPGRGHLDLFFPLWTGIRYFGEWSWFMPGSNMDFLAYDGFGYLGVGLMFLLSAALVSVVARVAGKNVGTRIERVLPSRWIVLGTVCMVLFAYAVGNKVYFSQKILFSYALPTWLDHVYNVFRASARMMWPAWYLMLLSIFYILLRGMPLPYVRGLVVLALLIQLTDLSKAAFDMRTWLSKNRAWHSALVAPVWSDLAARYRHLAYIQPVGVPAALITFVPDYRGIADYAAMHDMTINIAYLARSDEQTFAKVRAARNGLLLRGRVEPGTFYIIEDAPLWQKLICVPGSTSWYGTIDGLNVIVPDKLPSLSAMPHATCSTKAARQTL